MGIRVIVKGYTEQPENKGFTLAEMMVVMLILTIILAAFTPLMTKRKAVDLSNPWRYAANNSDIYFGLGANQTAMIGQSENGSSEKAKLIINSAADNQNHILFRQNATTYGSLKIDSKSNLFIGTPPSVTPMSGNTAIGIGAMRNIKATARYSTAVGSNALAKNNEENNTAVGYSALSSNTDGRSNTAIGDESATSITTGSSNTALGASALEQNKTGGSNTAIGSLALQNGTGSANTALGYAACSNATGSKKTCIGANSNPSAGSKFATDDVERIFIGSSSNLNPNYMNNDSISMGDAVLEVHNDAKPYVVINGNLVVRGYTYVATIPQSGDSYYPPMQFERDGWGGSGDNHANAKLWAGRVGREYETFAPSDKRLKNIKNESKSGLEQIRELKVYDFIYKKDAARTPHVGVIAQDLQKIFPNAVIKDDDGYLKIRKEDMFYAMLNSVKQLDTFVQGIINELKVILERVVNLENENKELRAKNKELEKRLEALESKI